MISQPFNHCSASLSSGRCSNVERGRYVPTSQVPVGPVTVSQLTMFILWKRMDSIPHPTGRSLVNIPTPHRDTLALDGRATKHVTLYPRQFKEYASVCTLLIHIILVGHSYKPTLSTWVIIF